ncbi:MAG: tripartite tricarboxylate transporter TctB family protein [Reyranellaceae bacterium]
MAIRNLKDFLSGAMFVAFGGLGLWFGRPYAIGTAFQMGPGYFPMLLSLGLIGIGLIVIVRALLQAGEAPEKASLRPLAVVLGAVAAFGLLVEAGGLVVAVVAAVLLGGLASRDSRRLELAALAAGMAAFCAALFVYGLGQPIPLWPR